MTLLEAIEAAGMTPPHRITEGRWVRFPGIGKGKANRSGWCRQISPTLAVFGDWSSGVSEVWRDSTHRDTAETARMLAEARARERIRAAELRRQQANAACIARGYIERAQQGKHAYLVRKGFPHVPALIHMGEPVTARGKEVTGLQLIVPMRDSENYEHIISAQFIDEAGAKLFLPNARAMGAVFTRGDTKRARKVVLCEGYATALSLYDAVSRLSGPHAVVATFSADNLVRVAAKFPSAVVAADHDMPNAKTGTKAGEEAAKRTSLRWTMPPEPGTDFNDMHCAHGLHAVTDALREVFAT